MSRARGSFPVAGQPRPGHVWQRGDPRPRPAAASEERRVRRRQFVGRCRRGWDRDDRAGSLRVPAQNPGVVALKTSGPSRPRARAPGVGLCTSRFGSSDTASAWCLRRPPRGRRHLRTRSKRPGPGSGRRQAPLAVADVFDPAGGEEAARVTDGTSPLRRIKLRCPRSAAQVAPMRWLSPSRPPQTCRQCLPFQVIRRNPPPRLWPAELNRR